MKAQSETPRAAVSDDFSMLIFLAALATYQAGQQPVHPELPAGPVRRESARPSKRLPAGATPAPAGAVGE